MLHKTELIRLQVKYMMNVFGKKSSKFLLVVGFLWNSKGR
jgi:Flp pilus assembly protein TadB